MRQTLYQGTAVLKILSIDPPRTIAWLKNDGVQVQSWVYEGLAEYKNEKVRWSRLVPVGMVLGFDAPQIVSVLLKVEQREVGDKTYTDYRINRVIGKQTPQKTLTNQSATPDLDKLKKQVANVCEAVKDWQKG